LPGSGLARIGKENFIAAENFCDTASPPTGAALLRDGREPTEELVGAWERGPLRGFQRDQSGSKRRLMERLTVVLGFAISFAAFVNCASAADLNAPVERKITVKSEIIRGYFGALDCNKPDSMNWLKVVECIGGVVSKETSQNTVSDPFKFGIYHEAYFNLWILKNATLSVERVDLLKNPAFRTSYQFFYNQSETLRKTLGLSFDDICSVDKAWGAKCSPP